MFQRFVSASGLRDDDFVLDVGATSDREFESSNYVEKWLDGKQRIVALGLDNAGHLVQEFPGMRVVRGDGTCLPFADRVFDVVHSSAVIEHVGSERRQLMFIRELCRVARRVVFLTTPNRWYPIEFHTVLPLVHWLPKPWHRALLSQFGFEALALESNLNLLERATLSRLAGSVSGYAFEVDSIRLLGMSSNLLLTFRRC
jgi:ubiquinone/menaquinone biosynthesis C-methylase UbiE